MPDSNIYKGEIARETPELQSHIESSLEVQDKLVYQVSEALTRLRGRLTIVSDSSRSGPTQAASQADEYYPGSPISQKIQAHNNRLAGLIEIAENIYRELDL